MERETAEERAAHLKEVCGDDILQRSEVESLLQMERKIGDLLQVPALSPDNLLDELPVAEGLGTIIGCYKLLERIGEGGTVAAYMAGKEKTIHRTVAREISKLGMDTR